MVYKSLTCTVCVPIPKPWLTCIVVVLINFTYCKPISLNRQQSETLTLNSIIQGFRRVSSIHYSFIMRHGNAENHLLLEERANT